MSSFEKNDEDSIDNENNIIDILVEYVKDELLKSNIRYEIVKPILIYLLYYLIPFILFIILLNFYINNNSNMYCI